MDCDVLVIGAGIAGLTSAYHFKKKCPELKVLIVEARKRVGGRTYGEQMNVGNGRKEYFDLGGQWIGPVQTDLLDLMKELDMSSLLYDQYLDGKKTCWIEPGHIINYNTELPFFNPLLYVEAYGFLNKVDSFADQLDENNPFLRNPALADYLDSMTLESFIRYNVHSPELRELVRIGIRTAFGFEACQISALYAILYGKSSGRMENLFSATNEGAQKMRVKGGMHQLSIKLANVIGEKNIIFDAAVTEIKQESEFVTVTATFNGGGSDIKFKTKRVISAIPPPHILKLKMSPPLPATRVEVLRALPMANLFKYVITYEKAFWREAGLSGETVCYGGNPLSSACPVGPVSVTFDASTSDGSAALVGFTAGHQTAYWAQCDVETRKNAILSNLSEMIGNEALKPLDYHEKNWALEEWTGGCPVACLQPGVGRFFTSSLRLPIGKIHLAGTETAQRSIGYMSGAVQSGRRAAVEVMYSLGKADACDATILASTCHGPAGRALLWPIKWQTVKDPCLSFMQKSNWGVRLGTLAGVAVAIVICRHFIVKKGFKLPSLEKLKQLWN